MPDKLHKTKGIVLRTVKYGETSVIVTIFTSLFGIQSYLVNGVRTQSRKSSGKAGMYQPGALLDLVVYHNELKHLNRIKEAQWSHLYQSIFSDVPKNAVALFLVELLAHCLKQPEPNVELFDFVEDAFIHLDESEGTVTANFPLFFALQLPGFLGFRIDDNYSEQMHFLDLQEGSFTATIPHHPHFLEDKLAWTTSQLLKVRQPAELDQLKMNQDTRRVLLDAYETFYAFHIQDFGRLKTLPVLREILG